MAETKEDNIRMNRIWTILPAFLLPVLVMVFLGARYGFVYEMNDDRFISQILSGAYSGTPDYHAIYVQFFLSYPLYLLYRIQPSVSWWGFMLLASFTLSQSVLLYYILRRIRIYAAENGGKKTAIWGSAAAILIFFALFLSQIAMVLRTQYTSVAVIIAATGYMILFLDERAKRSTVWFFLFNFLAFSMRERSMEMVALLGIPLYLTFTYAKGKRKIRKLIDVALALIMVFVLSLLGRVISGEEKAEWREFRAFNAARTEVYDYGAMPSYDDVRDILAENHVEPMEWQAFQWYTLTDFPKDRGLSKALSEYAANNHVKRTAGQVVQSVLEESVLRKEYRPILILWVLSLLMILLAKKPKYLLSLFVLLGCRMVLWAYLAYRGRIVDRVTLPFYITEGLFLIAIILFTLTSEPITRKRILPVTAVGGIAILVFVLLSALSGRKQVWEVSKDIEGQRIMVQAYQQMADYCNAHPENRYIADLKTKSQHATAQR